MLGVALGSGDFGSFELLAALNRGEHGAILRIVGGGGVVGSFDVDSEETIETNHFANGVEVFRAGGGSDFHRGLFDFGVGHLRGYRALPDEVIEAAFLRGAFNVVVVDVGGADCFVGFLRTFRLGVVVAHLEILLAEGRLDLFGY